MTKFRSDESMNMFRDHIDPEKEDQLKQIVVETDNKVQRIIKLVKAKSSNNKEANQRKNSEIVNLVEDFYKQYQSMYALYEDLVEKVKTKCNIEEDNESLNSYPLSMESAGYYSPGSGSKTSSVDQTKVTTNDTQSMKSENSCYSLDALSVASSYKEDEKGRKVEKLMEETGALRERLGEKENKMYVNLENTSSSKISVLEDRLDALKIEIESLSCDKSEHEIGFKGRHDEFHKRVKENVGFQVVDVFKEKENEVLKRIDEFEKILNGKVEESMDRVHDLRLEVDYLRLGNINFSHKKEKELESLRIQNQESEMELEKKSKEAVDSVELLENLTEKLKQKTTNEEALEINKTELEGKNEVLAATLEERDVLVSKLNQDTKSSFGTTVKKMGEKIDEFGKKSEDSMRILSRRIRVAEQLYSEMHEWYKKTRVKYEQDQQDNELAFHSIKIITGMVNDTLNVSETIWHRLTECCEDFTNRVSKASCEVKFCKDWVKRKNGAMVVQMDGKEDEVVGSRTKVLKLESKLRELEKIVKENDENVIVLQEEKREAIRQLCVWIDYHRSRSDSFKKAFSELVARIQKPALRC